MDFLSTAMDRSTSNSNLGQAAVINADLIQGDWKKEGDPKKAAENRMIVDVLRRSLREKRRPRKTIYGILVTDNYKTYKAYSSPYCFTGDISDYVLKFGKGKPHAATTQTSKSNFQRRHNDRRTSRRNTKTSNPRTKQDKATQIKHSDKLLKSNKKKLNRSRDCKKLEKLKRCVYYYKVLTRSKKNQLRKYLKCRS